MTGTTTGQTSLATATDSDDTEGFLTGPLTTDLQAVANLFESATGHDHSGAGKGKPIGSGGLANNAVTQNGFATAATAAPTVASGVYIDLAEMTVTLTTTGGDLLVWFTGTFTHSTPGNSISVAVSLDAAAEVGQQNLYPPTANFQYPLGIVWRFTGVSAASHTVKVRWQSSGATATAVGVLRQLLVMEAKR